MKIGVLGTGMVGQALAGKLASVGHQLLIGTRDPRTTLARGEKDAFGNPPFRVWHEANPAVKLGTLAEAASHGELVVNVLVGHAALEGLRAAGEENLEGKILIDVSNPLDFSKGMPPTLLVSNTDSLGEQIQRAFPRTRVVKTLNTLTASLMVEPGRLAGGEHSLFVSGNDVEAKAKVTHLLAQAFGWRDVIDLGDITTSRGSEMYVALWVRLWGALQTPLFSIRVVR